LVCGRFTRRETIGVGVDRTVAPPVGVPNDLGPPGCPNGCFRVVPGEVGGRRDTRRWGNTVHTKRTDGGKGKGQHELGGFE
jgi:hypothetical protein